MVEQLLSSSPQIVLMKTLYKEKEQDIGNQKKTVTFEEPDQKLIEVESKNPNKRICPGSRMLKKVDT